MGFLSDGIIDALSLIINFDQMVLRAANTTIQVGVIATVVASLIGIPIGFFLAVFSFKGKKILVVLTQTLLGLPTVVIGLIVYGFLSRRGPLGFTDLLFTPTAIVIGLVILAIPIVVVFSYTTIKTVDLRVRETAFSLGSSELKAAWTVIREIRYEILAVILAAFSRVSSEIGIALMLGGNIKGFTRTLTTAIALESTKGEFAFGIALSIILLSIILIANLLSFIFRKL
ncbi:MAG: ABC transporter permease [Nitrospinota bacterium]|nr:ABC transporter permease [Nitrospinota bacterium]